MKFKQIKEWFLGDWTLKEVQVASWTIRDSLFGEYTKFCTFKIFYSKRKNKYKLKCSGHKPKYHQTYVMMLRTVIKLNQNV